MCLYRGKKNNNGSGNFKNKEGLWKQTLDSNERWRNLRKGNYFARKVMLNRVAPKLCWEIIGNYMCYV